MAYGGWTGKTLRVNLTTRATSIVDTIAKYKDYIGGAGLAYKVLWDEVPAGTRALDPGNKIIFAVGPLSGTGAPLTGRCTIGSLLPYSVAGDTGVMGTMPGTGHMGGHFGPEIKFAGYDAIIIEGKAASPVWLRIEDANVTLEDASNMWGSGIWHANEEICIKMGSEAHTACIGQHGENMGLLSNIICDKSHSAGGGLGAVMGSKNLKAIGIKGTGSVKIATDAKSWKALNYYALSLVGSNNNHVVPVNKQAWAQYSDSGSRWTADKGIFWGAANPPVDTGICPDFEHPIPVDAPSPQNKMGRRCHKGYKDFGVNGANHTVRMNGCHSCPVRCHISMYYPELGQYGISAYNENTCVGYSAISGMMKTVPNMTISSNLNQNMSTYVTHDYGFWTDYGGYAQSYSYAYSHAMTQTEIDGLASLGYDTTGLVAGKTPFQCRLPASELTILSGNATGSKPYSASSPWGKAEAGDPSSLQDLMKLIALRPTNTPVFAEAVGNGTTYLAHHARTKDTPDGAAGTGWPEIAYGTQYFKSWNHFKFGYAKHHGVENVAQVGCLINLLKNRDPMNHSHSNQTVGPPAELRETIIKELFSSPTSPCLFNDPSASGVGLWDPERGESYTAMTVGKAAFAASCVVSVELKNSLIECDWTYPLWMSPLQSRGAIGNTTNADGSITYTKVTEDGFRGDPNISAMIYQAVTGETMTLKQLETIGLRIVTLFRALNGRYQDYWMKQANPNAQVNLRTDHDKMSPWMFEKRDSAANAATGNTNAYPATDVAFTGSTQLMTIEDMDTARDLLYDMFGWDRATGFPTSATLARLGLSYITADSAVAKLVVA